MEEKNGNVEIDKSAARETPRKGDGTQPAVTPARRANWFGSSDRPQEEFIGDQPNRDDSEPKADPIPPGTPSR